MTFLKVLKLLFIGFFKNGLINLCQVLIKNIIAVIITVILVIYLCINPHTAIYTWYGIAIFAIVTAIKAIVDIIIELKKYSKETDLTNKEEIIKVIGGKIFDFSLSAIGFLQAGQILKHSIRVAKSTSSALSVVDDVATAISKVLKEMFKVK